jgi:hypothetical protein
VSPAATGGRDSAEPGAGAAAQARPWPLYGRIHSASHAVGACLRCRGHGLADRSLTYLMRMNRQARGALVMGLRYAELDDLREYAPVRALTPTET